MKKILSLAILAGLALTLVQCKDKDRILEKTVVNVSPAEVSVQVGHTVKVAAIITPKEQGPAAWQSENDQIATVSDGVITGVATGETKVFAVAKSGEKAAVSVHVTEGSAPEIVIDSAVTKVAEGETIQIKVTGLPEGKKATFAVKDGKIASVDQEGRVTGILEGLTTLNIEALGKTYEIGITVFSKDLIKFVDEDFKKRILELVTGEEEEPMVDTNHDGEISKKEALAVSGVNKPLILGVGPEGGTVPAIKSLEDLKWFPNVTSLWLAALQKVTKLNTTYVPKCEYLNLAYSKIDNVDYSRIPLLKSLWFNGVSAKSLDLSHCPRLTALLLSNSEALTQLDISSCKDLALVYVDQTGLTKEGIKWPAELKSLEEIWISGTSLDPVEILKKSSALKKFFAAGLRGTHADAVIDLTPFKGLEDAYLDGNTFITGVKTDGLANLKMLSVSSCKVKEADLSTNPKLSYFSCFGTWDDVQKKASGSLTACNVANGNSAGFSFLGLADNPGLLCFKVDESVEIKNGEAYVQGKRVTWRPKDEENPGSDLHQDINWHVDAQTKPSYDCSSATQSVNKAGKGKISHTGKKAVPQNNPLGKDSMKKSLNRSAMRSFPGIAGR